MVKKNIKKVNLNLIRKKIDEIDKSILKSLSKRANLVIEAGLSKEKIGDTSYYRPEREAQIIHSLISENKLATFACLPAPLTPDAEFAIKLSV